MFYLPHFWYDDLYVDTTDLCFSFGEFFCSTNDNCLVTFNRFFFSFFTFLFHWKCGQQIMVEFPFISFLKIFFILFRQSLKLSHQRFQIFIKYLIFLFALWDLFLFPAAIANKTCYETRSRSISYTGISNK